MSIQILMPALSPTMEEGKLAKWLVKEGDAVKSGDVLAEIETDKATMEFEAVDEGRIGKILVPEGTEGVKVNAPIAVLLGDGESAATAADIPTAMKSIKDAVTAEAKPKPSVSAVPAMAPAPKAEAAKHAPVASGLRIFASPLARRIAQQKGFDLSTLAGSGPRGRIVKEDVEHAKLGAAKPAVSAPAAIVAGAAVSGVSPLPDARLFYGKDDYVEIPHDSMRKSIAKRLSSATALIPHFYLTIDCRIDALMAARSRLNEASPKGEGAYKLSVNDFIVKAVALALKRVPECNASWTDSAVLRHKHADVGVAVALDFGLITPIVFRAEEKGLAVISNEVKSLAERARTKKLKPQEYEGGSFAISNLGMFGIKDFTAVINPPHAGILAVGAGEQRAVVVNGKVEIATVMTVTMSCDHRVIDGATGARFLQVFKQCIEEPAAMLL
ncbi:MAG: pyruvate dehydrogenase complex dihydrolipoamide acetyltransferase [Alphaproteobacteria bacterium]|nr:pyruvate dehydrogenase complex dihydrolipoamide acetyltransferase [Alphaproteobacteria bacterium]MDE1985283.1 pyruvate dehydrogenase complex dihydrolipoamide acetyltransferase [Alphaproteobacteria bacterium]MDE2162622.1 pyruvate dehydrogenase complex dihydrolipoamide acetyltransferase [Alphaproteobacteria bacterium]MDE2498618.1 pyruvate dehydrogenase complex dihydrolipoamide acetyltransferase [Alphaproteobacteria bacterium]